MAQLAVIEWYRGDSYPIELLVQDENEDPITLTGSSLLFTVNSVKDPEDDSDQKFEVVGVIDPDQVTNMGLVTFTPTTVQTDLAKAIYYYDIQLTNSSGDIKTIMKNKFKVLQDITK